MENLSDLILPGLLLYGAYYLYTEVYLEGGFGKKKAAKTDNRDAYAQQMLAVDRHLTAEGVSLEDRQAKLTPLMLHMLQRNQPVQMPACRFPEGQQ